MKLSILLDTLDVKFNLDIKPLDFSKEYIGTNAYYTFFAWTVAEEVAGYKSNRIFLREQCSEGFDELATDVFPNVALLMAVINNSITDWYGRYDEVICYILKNYVKLDIASTIEELITKIEEVKTISILEKVLISRKDDGDFQAFNIESLTNVRIEVASGKNYRLHEEEINYLIKSYEQV